MAKIKVYRFATYDIHHDAMVDSTRVATLDKIKVIGGEPRGDAVEIEESQLKDGWTDKNFQSGKA